MMNKNKKTKIKGAKPRRDPREQDPNSTGSRALRVEVTRINFYERNPRRSKNPEYDRIKASILVSGMDQPLLITMRPCDDDYVVHAGGNTRLQIMQELYESTGDERFYWVDCLFVEWDRESTVLLAHLRENELRGNLTFIDKAQAIFDAKSLIVKELGVSDISDREFENILKDHGYSVSYVIISLMGFAVSVLLPLLPTALASGLGKPQVRRIRNLERVGREIWSLRGIGPEAEFDEVFEVLCRRCDSVDWQFEPLRQGIEIEIAEAAEISIQVIRMEFDCRLSGRELDIPDFVNEEETRVEEFPVSPRDEPSIASEAERQAEAITSSGFSDGRATSGMAPDEQLHAGQATDQTQDPPEVAIELPLEADNEALFRRIGIQSKNRVPIELLRAMAYRLAQRLAERHGMAALIAPLRDNGLGFLVRDIPSASVVDQLDDDMLAQVSTMWWQLTAFAEMAVAPPELLVNMLDEESFLSSTVLAGQSNRLFDKVWTVDPAFLAQRFWRQLNHEDWCDWLCLAHNYRELHRMASMLNTPLWSTAT
jgi:ParB family protein of integrating conjugative element (PFGI_1 class)